MKKPTYKQFCDYVSLIGDGSDGEEDYHADTDDSRQALHFFIDLLPSSAKHIYQLECLWNREWKEREDKRIEEERIQGEKRREWLKTPEGQAFTERMRPIVRNIEETLWSESIVDKFAKLNKKAK